MRRRENPNKRFFFVTAGREILPPPPPVPGGARSLTHTVPARGSHRCPSKPRPPPLPAFPPPPPALTSLPHSPASELSCSRSLSPFMVKQLCLGEAFFFFFSASW